MKNMGAFLAIYLRLRDLPCLVNRYDHDLSPKVALNTCLYARARKNMRVMLLLRLD